MNTAELKQLLPHVGPKTVLKPCGNLQRVYAFEVLGGPCREFKLYESKKQEDELVRLITQLHPDYKYLGLFGLMHGNLAVDYLREFNRTNYWHSEIANKFASI